GSGRQFVDLLSIGYILTLPYCCFQMSWGKRDWRSLSMRLLLNRILYKVIRLPIVGPATRYVLRRFFSLQFTGSEAYWRKRYEKGGHSGPGSYDKLAEYKAETLNRFVADHQITDVIEFGCGDGNQLRLAQYPRYIGYDISPIALARCRELF